MLKRTMVAALAVLLLAATQASAAPNEDRAGGPGRGRGMMMGRGEMGGERLQLCDDCREKVQRYRRQRQDGQNVERPQLCEDCQKKVQRLRRRGERMRDAGVERGDTGRPGPEARLQRRRERAEQDRPAAEARQGRRRMQAERQAQADKREAPGRRMHQQGRPAVDRKREGQEKGKRPQLCGKCQGQVLDFLMRAERIRNARPQDRPGREDVPRLCDKCQQKVRQYRQGQARKGRDDRKMDAPELRRQRRQQMQRQQNVQQLRGQRRQQMRDATACPMGRQMQGRGVGRGQQYGMGGRGMGQPMRGRGMWQDGPAAGMRLRMQGRGGQGFGRQGGAMMGRGQMYPESRWNMQQRRQAWQRGGGRMGGQRFDRPGGQMMERRMNRGMYRRQGFGQRRMQERPLRQWRNSGGGWGGPRY